MREMLGLIFVLTCLSGCDENKIWRQEQLLSMIRSHDSTVEIILPMGQDQVINCSDYTPPCRTAHRLKVKGLECLALEFPSAEEAEAAALPIKAFYSRNWVFDDVYQEPILEKLVQKAIPETVHASGE